MVEVERELIIRACEGDMRAFETIYQRTSGFVYSLAFRVTQRKHDAEEVVQDVFLKVHRHLQDFKFESSFKTWLYRVTMNTALNAAKKKNRIAAREIEDPEDHFTAVVPGNVTRGLETKEAEEKVQGLLQKLNPDQRACILLREIEGLDYQGIAATLGVNLNTVRTRLKRAREALMILGQKEVTSHGM